MNETYGSGQAHWETEVEVVFEVRVAVSCLPPVFFETVLERRKDTGEA